MKSYGSCQRIPALAHTAAAGDRRPVPGQHDRKACPGTRHRFRPGPFGLIDQDDPPERPRSHRQQLRDDADRVLGTYEPRKTKRAACLAGPVVAGSAFRPPAPDVPAGHPYQLKVRTSRRAPVHDEHEHVQDAYADDLRSDVQDAGDPAPIPIPAAPTGRVDQALTSSGHGFLPVKVSPTYLTEVCRYCGSRVLPVDETSRCEFGPLGDVFTDDGGDPPSYLVRIENPLNWRCECNGCRLARAGRRKRGNQPEVCQARECRKAMKRDQQRRYRAKKR